MSGALMSHVALATLALVTALIGVRIVERYAEALRLVDRPNLRSSHVHPRPRGGGLGILLGIAVAAVAAHLLDVGFSSDLWVLLGATLVVSASGLWDDLQSLSIWPRLLVHIAAAVAVVWHFGGLTTLPLPSPADLPVDRMTGQLLAVLWMVSVTNFFNFMDGLDGLAGGQALITLSALTWALWPGDLASLTFITAAATVGFLLRNWSPAKIFLGDVGSSFLGFLMAAVPLAVPPASRSSLMLMIGTSLILFLMDPVVTLIARYRRGAKLGEAHREHAYQQFVAPDRPHGPAVLGLLFAALALSLVAVAAYRHAVVVWPSLAVALLAFWMEWRRAGVRRKRSQSSVPD